MKLKIMTYNIAAGRTYFQYAETKKAPVDLRESADFIKGECPAVCGLNEVDKLTKRSGEVDQIAFFEEYIGMNGLFCKTIDLQGGEYGNGFLTRFPVLDSEIIHIPDVEGKSYEHRAILKVRVDLDGKIVTFLQTHSGLSDQEKVNCVDTLCAIIDSLDTPVVLMGDFNMSPDFHALEKIRARLTDTAPLLNNGEFYTFGTYEGVAKQHIDYIFVSKEIKPLSLTVVDTMISDHYPVIMECEMGE